jgi:Cellulase (glycosyl hydrolase family 5)
MIPRSRPVSERRRRIVCVLALLAALFAVAAADARKGTAPKRATTSDLLGITISGVGGNHRVEIAAARALHAKAVRMQVSWSELEPHGPKIDPGALHALDRAVEEASADKLGVILEADSTPCWDSTAPSALLRQCNPSQESAAMGWPPVNGSYYASLMATLAARYGSRLDAIEIWNEPDQKNEDYWAGPEKAARYVALLRAAYTAIKQADPSTQVLGGAIVGTKGGFLKLLYADGMKGYYDGLAVHFYSLTVAALRETHELQLANGDDTPLWLEEFGFSSCWPRQSLQQEQGCVTSKLQGVDLSDIVRQVARLPYVAATIVYKVKGSLPEDFGVLTAAGTRKSAFAALASAFANPFGPITKPAVRLRRQGSSLLASGSAAPGDFMELEAFHGKALRFTALFTLNRFNQFALSLPSAIGTSDISVRLYQAGQGTTRAAVAHG